MKGNQTIFSLRASSHRTAILDTKASLADGTSITFEFLVKNAARESLILVNSENSL